MLAFSISTAILPGEPGLVLRLMVVKVTTGAIRCAKLRSNQHPTCYRPDALPVAQPTVSKHWSIFILRASCGRLERKYREAVSVSVLYASLFSHAQYRATKFGTRHHREGNLDPRDMVIFRSVGCTLCLSNSLACGERSHHSKWILSLLCSSEVETFISDNLVRGVDLP